MSRCVPLATEYAPSPSLIWIDPRPCDPMRIWMRPIPARCRSAAPSAHGDPRVAVGAAEEVHPLPRANAQRDGRRPPSRPPYGRRFAAHRAPPSKIEAHHAALPLLASSALALTFQGDSRRFRSGSGRFRSHWRAAATRSHSRCCAPPLALRASASARHRTQPRNPSHELDETHRTQPRNPS